MFLRDSRRRSGQNTGSGQSIVETVVGIMFLIPIVLFLLDIFVLVMSNTANDNLAKSAARAAASAKDPATLQGNPNAAYGAATSTASTFAESSIISKPSSGSFLTAFSWNDHGLQQTQGNWPATTPKPVDGNVAVVTTMTVRVPVPFPFLPDKVDFQAKAVEPVVSVAAGTDISQLNNESKPFDPSKNDLTKPLKPGDPGSMPTGTGEVSTE